MRTRVKVCCIASVEEARLTVSLGADALSLVDEMPSGPGPIPDTLIREIATGMPPPVATFLLTSRTTAEGIADHVAACGVNTVQAVRHLDLNVWPRLAERLPANVRRV